MLVKQRSRNYCTTCGAAPSQANPDRVGMSEATCAKCGAFKSAWRARLIVPKVHKEAEREERRAKRDFRAEWERRMRIRAETLAKQANMPPCEEFPVYHPIKPKKLVNDRKVANKLAADAAWQDAHEKRMAALRRLGMDRRAGDDEVGYQEFFGMTKLLAVRKQEDARNPKHELLEAARAGDKRAVQRATALYGDSWRKRRVA